MGEHIDKLVRLQSDPVISLSLMEHVKSYRKKDGTQVSAHERKGTGPGVSKGKAVFTNAHGVDTADIHLGDRVEIDREHAKQLHDSFRGVRAEQAHYFVASKNSPKTGVQIQGHDKKDKLVGIFDVDPQHITKVSKTSAIAQRGAGREHATETARKHHNQVKIKALEKATGISDHTDAEDAAREQEIEDQMKKLQQELEDIRARRRKAE